MLVLTRRRQESILIDGGKIKITVINIQGGQVKLGIQANGMVVDREEIHDRRVRCEPRADRKKKISYSPGIPAFSRAEPKRIEEE